MSTAPKKRGAKRRGRPRPKWVPVIAVDPPRRLLGHAGPVVLGVMADAPPSLVHEWVNVAA